MSSPRRAGSAPDTSGKRAHVPIDAVRLPSFGLEDSGGPFDGTWHEHRFHQLLYAAEGALHLSTREGTWLLPPQRMAWIAAGVEHQVSTRQPVELRTVYLGRSVVPPVAFRCRVFAASPLAREMMLHAMRWDHRRAPQDQLARAFFAALAGLALEWSEHQGPFHLPAAQGEELRRATEWVMEHLDREVPVEEVARVSRTSLRTLARRFQEELGMTFRDYLKTARMLRAMELLAQPGARVTEVALAVGFSSPSAFTAAFVDFHGEPPRAFRKARSAG